MAILTLVGRTPCRCSAIRAVSIIETVSGRRRNEVRRQCLRTSSALAMTNVSAKELSTSIGDLVLRPLSVSDLSRSFFALLSQLTKAPPLSHEAFATYVSALDVNPDHVVLVAEARDGSGPLLGTASVLIERKALRGGGKVGHVEDVVVDAAARGASLGKALIERLAEICEERGCYKVILDCAEDNVKFYERCGFQRKEVQMAMYF